MSLRYAIRRMGLCDYRQTLNDMRAFTYNRSPDTPDEFWLVEHQPVYTQGEAGSPAHILRDNGIEVVATDRGGQVTYHGPGQAVIYPLIDLKRHQLGMRTFVYMLEQAVIDWLAARDITAVRVEHAPGVFVGERKICAIGLRSYRRYVYHGLALNIDMDLSPFNDINPCGFQRLKHTNVSEYTKNYSLVDAQFGVCRGLIDQLDGARYAQKRHEPETAG